MRKYTSPKEKDDLYAVFRAIVSNRKLYDEFIIDLFTPTEYKEIHTRLQIIKLLEKGMKHRDVAEMLGVGIATVNRGALELRDPQGGFRQLLKKLKK